MTPAKRRRNSWIAGLLIISPFLWTIPTYFYLRADTESKNSGCEFALKHFGIKLLVEYPANHGGRLPQASKWMDALREFQQKIYRCPSDPNLHPVSYAMNSNLSGKLLSEIRKPSELILLYETNSKAEIPFGTGEDLVDIGKPASGQGRHNLIAYRFNFFVMADGTVRRAGTPDEMKNLRWKP